MTATRRRTAGTDPVRPECESPPAIPALRAEVRDFLAEQRAARLYVPGVDTWLSGFDPAFSEALGRRGWLGMTFPLAYGGGDRSALERYVVIEELLAAGAPVAAHWFADRQVGPSLLSFGTEHQRRRYLHSIAAGRCFFAIGLSEPDSGSDLASVRTRAARVEGGWQVEGTKVWTSGAHRCHHMLTLVRTTPGARRHEGLSQLLIDLSSPGITVRPIRLLTGEHHFNEVVFDDVFVPDDCVLGEIGNGWEQVNAELAYERSGPERFLSTMPLVAEFANLAQRTGDPRAVELVGRLYSELWSIRQLSLGVAASLDAGELPSTAAALVKDVGTRFEQSSIEAIREVVGDPGAGTALESLLWHATQHSPGFTLRGGTSEIMQLLIARGLVS